MKFSGISIHNFRSIGEEGVHLHPWNKTAILVGQNNAGKSNVVDVVKRTLNHQLTLNAEFAIDELDHHQRSPNANLSVSLYFGASQSEDEPPEDRKLMEFVPSETVRFDFSLSEIRHFSIISYSLGEIANSQDVSKLANYLYTAYGRGIRFGSLNNPRDFLTNNRNNLYGGPFKGNLPKVLVIPEIRKIVPIHQEHSYDGSGLVGILDRLSRPSASDSKENQIIAENMFARIVAAFRKLMHLPQAKVAVDTGSNIKLDFDGNGNWFPIESYGAGAKELLIMLTSILGTLSDKPLLWCIEEPELHLHPRLQREFINFLTTETEHMYLITTHSSALINARSLVPPEHQDDIAVFHLEQRDNATISRAITGSRDAIAVLGDMGAKPSDLMQANCVIWVEGPSDRIYLLRWLELLAPDLIESLHFAVMFYAGRNLKHLLDTDIISINPRTILQADRHRKNTTDTLAQSTQDMQKRIANANGYFWVTDGYEVENYLEANAIIDAYAKESELGKEQIKFTLGAFDKFEDELFEALHAANAKNPVKYSNGIGKVGYARLFVKHIQEQHISSQLKQHLEAIIALIREWNV